MRIPAVDYGESTAETLPAADSPQSAARGQEDRRPCLSNKSRLQEAGLHN